MTKWSKARHTPAPATHLTEANSKCPKCGRGFVKGEPAIFVAWSLDVFHQACKEPNNVEKNHT